MADKLRTRKTPNGRHLYVATMRGQSVYGYGNTPADARAKFHELRERFAAEIAA